MTVAHTSIQTDELLSTLHATLPSAIAELQRKPSPYASTFPLEEVYVRFEDQTELSLVLKDLSPASASAIKPSFLYDPRREIETYRSILAPRRLGTAVCYAAVADDARQRYWLVLEKVAGVELYQCGDVRMWQAAARWLAELHVRTKTESDSLAWSAPLLRHSAAFYAGWMDRAQANARDADRLEALHHLARGYRAVLDRLTSLPSTLIHGEFYASNVLVQPLHEGLRVCPIDWEMVSLGPGLIDLAALTAGSWSESARQAIVKAYREALADLGDRTLPERDFDLALECCRLQLALQWLGWSPAWHPPLEHARDWLAVALDAAARLGL